jgi:membrane dipeptidase
MKKCFLFFTTCLIYNIAFTQPYKKLHFAAVLIDTHNDIPSSSIEKKLAFDND